MKKIKYIQFFLNSFLFFVIALILQNTALHAQNLVPNPGFEQHYYDSVIYWQHPEKPYYHFITNSKSAHSGNCLLGICDWTSQPTEYLQVKLTSPLIKDKKYRVKLFTMMEPVYMKEKMKDSAWKMGICFRKDSSNVVPKNFYFHKPDIILYVYKDTLWHKTETDYIANGGENYLIMGHFYDDNDIQNLQVDINYQKYLEETEILTMEKPETLKTEIDKIVEKYKPLVDESWNIEKEKSLKKQEKLIREFRKAMVNKQVEIRDKTIEIEKEYEARINDVGEKYNIEPKNRGCTNLYRLYFDDISVETPPEPTQVQEQIIILNNVFFNTAEWILLPASFVELDKHVAYLKQKPNLKVEISGHTDIVGNDEDNQLLSENRAKAVVEYFIQKGISPEKLTYKGYGRTKPIASNQTDEGRARNRRVEMKIISE
jgi:outer membrane protein OmpA-like peptidoglycan-associated protein